MNVDEFLDTENHNQEVNKSGGVKAIPEEYQGATPYLNVNMAPTAIDFYQKAFGAKVLVILKDEKNRIVHAEIQIGKARIMLAEEAPERGSYGPRHLGGATSGFILYFEDADAAFKKAIAAGAKELMKMDDCFWGDRAGKVEDPFGHQWFLCTHKEDVSYDEMKKRGEEMFRKKVH